MDIGFLFFIFDYGFWILDLLKGIMDFDVKLKVDVDWIEVGLTWYELDGVTRPRNPMLKKKKKKKKKDEEDQTKPSMKGKRKKEKKDQRERKKKKKRRRRRRPPKLIEPSEKKKKKRKGQKLRLLLWP